MTTKMELVTKLAKEHGLSEKKTLAVVNSLLSEVQQRVLKDGRRVMLRGFGSFWARKSKTSGLKPGTQERWTRPARNVIAFEPHTASGGLTTTSKGYQPPTTTSNALDDITKA